MKEMPTAGDLARASEVLRAYQLHFYQLLWFQDPKLTTPGHPGSPFDVDFHPVHRLCIQFKVTTLHGRDKGYDFIVNSGVLDHLEESDKIILSKCQLILESVRDGKEKIHRRACCPVAIFRGCVCEVSFDCVIHGTMCIGSHD